ncbi:hypothetical protein M407DRAFT_199114 [Tulasnella calospora MUT 4182]|uniref:Uncharacterized protein n=1 Tax=Tulasnella calospora MUT 4182 TaxID=1051891 RepID=A0A0C3LHB9_9AGAM|nr:hypothetical protein M407DRAFT_199114 [Tulasnella calospora MUT 4182]
MILQSQALLKRQRPFARYCNASTNFYPLSSPRTTQRWSGPPYRTRTCETRVCSFWRTVHWVAWLASRLPFFPLASPQLGQHSSDVMASTARNTEIRKSHGVQLCQTTKSLTCEKSSFGLQRKWNHPTPWLSKRANDYDKCSSS